MGVVEQAVADRIREGGVADELMPLGDRKLARHDRRASAVSVVEELEEVAAIVRREGIEPEIVDEQHVFSRLLLPGDPAIDWLVSLDQRAGASSPRSAVPVGP